MKCSVLVGGALAAAVGLSALSPVREAMAAQEGVFSGGDGVIYGVTSDGKLQWYRHNGRETGSSDWTAGNGGRNVGTGWNMYGHVFSGGDGVIYGITSDGKLQWYRHDGWRTGSSDWTAGDGGRNVGTGWNMFR